ncbi:MAG: DNA-processing protein DprA [Mariprofundaceae bacterium]|nr:DNA-processing protein DprA [Mariprofundaceae bacterium]
MTATSNAASDWLRLSLVRGIGPCIGRQLVNVSGSIAAVWNNNPADWQHIDNIGNKLIQALKRSGPDQASHILRQCESNAITVVCPDDEAWPETFSAMDDAPLVLFVKGDLATLKYPKLLAVVGARKASREGRMLTRRWCRFLAERGIGIVSGMAYGIDAAAHGGALEGNAPTIAVLGCGLTAPFSPEQQCQIKAVAAQGCVISEFLPETEARPEHFPRRNRIIAGLTMATLVMEADIQSGSLITARQAIDYGREVMAVPGSVLSGNHAGCHQLIRDGAALVESSEDIPRVLKWHTDSKRSKASHYKPANTSEAKIIKALESEIMHIDTLAQHCGLTVPELSPILLALELLGVVESLPGSRYAMGDG